MWQQILVWVITTVLSALLAPRPKAPESAQPGQIGNQDVPIASQDAPIPVLFGTRLLSGPNVVWYRRRTGPGDSQVVGREEITRVTVAHARELGYCVKGIRRWFDGRERSWEAFVEHGVDSDWLQVTAINLVAQTVTLERGLLDTVPVAHAVGARLPRWSLQTPPLMATQTPPGRIVEIVMQSIAAGRFFYPPLLVNEEPVTA
jgi:hypothetical protein